MAKPLKLIATSMVCVLAAFSCGAVIAAEAGPFDLSAQGWTAVATPVQQNPAAPVAPAGPTPPTIAAPVAVAAPAPAVPPQAVALPLRPLHLSSMPGIGTNYQIDVSSTADHAAQSRAGAAREVLPQEKDWRRAADEARKTAIAEAKRDGEDLLPLDIRPSFLPNPDVAPENGAPRPARKRFKNLPVAAAATQKTVQRRPAVDSATCAAVDDFKKHQLEALQDDRQTLMALQSAIADLGLQKQLGYMAGLPATASAGEPASTQAQGHP